MVVWASSVLVVGLERLLVSCQRYREILKLEYMGSVLRELVMASGGVDGGLRLLVLGRQLE